MPAKIDITGRRFGSLVVIREDATRSNDGKVRWECRCDCGATHVVPGRALRNGTSKRCPACNKQWLIERGRRQFPTSHGMSNSPEFKIWWSVIRRCTNPNDSAWASYGGRGIKICQRWRDSFQAFYDDMGPRPAGHSAGGRALYSIERRDVDGDYCPENCYWATDETQARNRTDNIWLTYNGVRMCQADAAKAAGLTVAAVISRRKRGWPEEHWLKPMGFRMVGPVEQVERCRKAARSRAKYWVELDGERIPLAEAARRQGIDYWKLLYKAQNGQLARLLD